MIWNDIKKAVCHSSRKKGIKSGYYSPSKVPMNTLEFDKKKIEDAIQAGMEAVKNGIISTY